MSVIQYWKALFCFAFMPLYIGGDKKQSTTSTSANYDNRTVLTDSQNSYDLSNRSVTNTADNRVTNSAYDLSNRSVTNTADNRVTNSAYDLSNRSVTSNSTSNAWADSSNSGNTSSYDLSNRSITTTNNSSDNSNRSTNYTTTTDGGAVAGALGFAKDAAGGAFDSVKSALGFAAGVATGQQAGVIHAYDWAGGIFDSSLDAMNMNDARAYNAYDRAALITKDALSMSAAASKSALDGLQNAYADAKGTTQASQKMIFAVLAVAGAAIIATKMRA